MRWFAFPLVIATVAAAFSQTVTPEEALRRAAANEEKLREAEKQYSYRQQIEVQMKGEGGSVRGQLHRVSEITYDDLGNRVERILEFPPSRLMTALGVMKPDFKSFLGVEPFFLTSGELQRYRIKFVERQKVDDLNTFVFDISPTEEIKRIRRKDKDPPFEGRVWIDDQDFQIVKAQGRAVTHKESSEQYPKFEYYREYVDDKYWLPSFAYVDDVIAFTSYDLPLKMKFNYSNYRRVQSKK
ncbi:MAG: hypothetical protein AB1631_16715 [Acidobacteriota bacterium]